MAQQKRSGRPDDRSQAAASGSEVNATAPRTDEVGGCCGVPGTDPQAQAPRQAGRGGAPTTGAGGSPGEGVTEEEMRQSGLD